MRERERGEGERERGEGERERGRERDFRREGVLLVTQF